MKHIRLIPDDTNLPFMKWARIRTPISLALIVLSFALFFTIGVNAGIDFKGGTVIEVHSHQPDADIAGIRSKLDALDLGEVQIQNIGGPDEVLIRIAAQPGGDAAEQAAVQKVRDALGVENYDFRRVEVVGPRVSSELARTGTLAVLLTIAGIMAYIWIRFEWQFGLAAVATLVHDAILTVGFFAATQIDFNLQSLAAILTIIGYSLNDTVVIFDRIRELLRKYKQMPVRDIIDLATNQTLARTIMTSLTLLLALLSLFVFGGPVIRSFTAAMIWGIIVATASSIFIGGPILIYFNIRPSQSDEKVPEKKLSPKPSAGTR
ncbi:protein-export membrane protein SecF [Aureimonas endophytica]|uniref:Protein-export membrane protein SecF n=1 Tax=Aureimonas endophytica TaxID=2027858 RepID=A0A916ZCS7_9HYPH|nr:protein translocase subunit SecF [Aureimonas endophytica]GGD87173.1 protein-export membrane protein SecF [Aureimonas endophytica]